MSWIRARFVGTCIGDRVRDGNTPSGRGPQADRGNLRRFSFELHSGRVFAPESVPEPPPASDAVAGGRPPEVRQQRLARVRFPAVDASSPAEERTLFDVRISDWLLRHPAEVGGRSLGTLEGTLLARLHPEAAASPSGDGAPAADEDPTSALLERTSSGASVEAGGSSGSRGRARLRPRTPSQRFDASRHHARLRAAFAISGVAAIGAGLAFLCGVQTAAIWAAPVVVALALRRLVASAFGGGAIDASPPAAWQAWLGAALVVSQAGLLVGPLEGLWRMGCRIPMREELLYLAVPLVVAAVIRRHAPLLISSLVWTGVMCTWCADLDGTCSATAAPIRAVGPAVVGSRTDATGRWPVMPASPESGAAASSLGQSARSESPGFVHSSEARGSTVPSGASGPSVAPESSDPARLTAGGPLDSRAQEKASGAQPGPEAPGGSSSVPVDAATRGVASGQGGPSAALEGGWLAPDLHSVPREVSLISIEHANRRPGEFFDSRGERRVYLPTDSLFDATGTRVSQAGALQLARLAALLSLHPERRVIVEVHTDAGGSAAGQLQASRLRAGAVRQWLLDRGHLAPSQFQVRGAGAERPLVPPDGSYAAQQPNRRIEVALVD